MTHRFTVTAERGIQWRGKHLAKGATLETKSIGTNVQRWLKAGCITAAVGTEQEWISAVYELLCESHGKPRNQHEKRNLMNWAKAIFSDGYFAQGKTPKEAHDSDMPCFDDTCNYCRPL